VADGNKAAVFYGPRDIRIEYREIPTLGPDEVLIRSTDACICATEVKYWYHGMPRVPPGTRVIQGHELGGIVEDVGSDVKDKDIVGAKVAVDPSLWCGVCDMCRAGMPNLCRNLQFMSLPPVDGGYQQFYKVPERNVHPVPEEMPSQWSSIVEPVNIGINAISDAEHIVGSLSGKAIAIVGAGPQGLLLMQTAAVMSSPRKICVLEPLEYRREFAKELGASEIIDPHAENPLDRVMDMTNGAGVDVAFEVAGEAGSYQLAATLVKPGGTVVIVGIPIDQDYISIQAITARRAGLTLTFVRRFNPKDFPRAVDMIASGEVEVASLITHRFPLDDITSAFEMLHTYSDGVVKAIIHPHA
jgi:threonine dehydrogenase-like Zn-dependent dehydrogenase